jgi:mRNA-degrading endonuclease RelE of RelBE toxin-antitoxin system
LSFEYYRQVDYRIQLTESARADINYFETREQRIIVAGILAHLRTDAEIETRKKKRLRPNPLAPWELRLEEFRVFYSIEESSNLKVLAVGYKEHNELFIRGRRVEL